MSDIVERANSWDRCYPGNVDVEALVVEMADTITALRAENERLREALEECREILSDAVMYLPEPAQAENAIAYAEKLLGSMEKT